VRQTELHLKPADRQTLQNFRTQGQHAAREVNRAHILLALDQKLPESTITSVLGVSRSVVWRTRSAYGEKGLAYALHDVARSGQPRKYGTDQQAEIVALACSQPPAGAKRWTLRLLVQAARDQPKLAGITQESVRQFLKKTAASPGAK
jgi:transposase